MRPRTQGAETLTCTGNPSEESMAERGSDHPKSHSQLENELGAELIHSQTS